MTDHNADGSVRITNQKIYELLLDTRGDVSRVAQTMREVMKPGLETAKADIRHLSNTKADRTELAKTDGRLLTVEYRVYAIVAGLIAAFVGGKGLGIL